MFKEDIFRKEIKIRKLMIINKPGTNNYGRNMQETIEYKIMKRSYAIISK
jgi:hypothetical protein